MIEYLQGIGIRNLYAMLLDITKAISEKAEEHKVSIIIYNRMMFLCNFYTSGKNNSNTQKSQIKLRIFTE